MPETTSSNLTKENNAHLDERNKDLGLWEKQLIERYDPEGDLDPNFTLIEACLLRAQRDRESFLANGGIGELEQDHFRKVCEAEFSFARTGLDIMHKILNRAPQVTVVELYADLDRSLMAYDDTIGDHAEVRPGFAHFVERATKEFPQVRLEIIPLTDRKDRSVKSDNNPRPAPTGLKEQVAKQLDDPRVQQHLNVGATVSVNNGPEMAELDERIDIRYEIDADDPDRQEKQEDLDDYRFRVFQRIASFAMRDEIIRNYHTKAGFIAECVAEHLLPHEAAVVLDDLYFSGLIDNGDRIVGWLIEEDMQPRLPSKSEWDF